MKQIILIYIISLFSINVTFGNTWETIKEKTWIAKKDFPIDQYVFYETKNGLKKAIFQIEGSGRCAIISLIYDVELKENIIYLKNELDLVNSTLERGKNQKQKILYLKNDVIISENSKIIYKKAFDYARICNWIETYSGYQIIPIQALKEIPLEKNHIYDTHSINLGPNPNECGIDNNAELTDYEATFLNEYLFAHLKKFDFHNKKILFVTGSNGNTIGSKVEYFNNVREWKEKHNAKISTSFFILSEKEKKEYGYDAIITYWVKVFSPNTKRVLKKIKDKGKENEKKTPHNKMYKK